MERTKSIGAMAHRPGSDRQAFQTYYEERHAPLAIGYFPFCRYVRNHVLEGEDFGFDTISEFWARDIAATAALMDGPVGDIMRADEEKFMDRARTAAAGARPYAWGDDAAVAADGTRVAHLVDWTHTDTGADAGAALLRWAEGVAAGGAGLALDYVESWREPAFPARAVVWSAEPCDIAVAGTRVRRVRVRRVETPPALLLGNR